MAESYPEWLCSECGHKAQQDKDKISAFATWHMHYCDVCGDMSPVTQPRDFGYPDFGKRIH